MLYNSRRPLREYPDHVSPLARQLRATDYFTLGWGTMVGVGWLVIMDDWLLRGGALGALLGFVIGGSLLLPIGWVYGKLVVAMPDAAGEIAYTSAVFPRAVSFATGWMMTLAYFIVCPWEAVAVGRIAGYIIPGLDSIELYRIAGRPVYQTEQSAKLNIEDTGTTITAGQTMSSGDDKWLRKFGAEQKLLDGVNVSGSIGETAQGITTKSISAGFKRSW